MRTGYIRNWCLAHVFYLLFIVKNVWNFELVSFFLGIRRRRASRQLMNWQNAEAKKTKKNTNKLCVTVPNGDCRILLFIYLYRYSNVITAAVVMKKSQRFRVCPALPAAVHAKCVIAIGSVSYVRRLYSRHSSTSFAPKSKANPFTKPFVQLAPTWNSSFSTCRDLTMTTKNYFTAVCQLSARCVHLFFDAQWDSSYKVR